MLLFAWFEREPLGLDPWLESFAMLKVRFLPGNREGCARTDGSVWCLLGEFGVSGLNVSR